MSKVMDGGVEAGVRMLLQLALDEMRNVVEAVDDNLENKRWPVKYGTPYGAINGMVKVREAILAQCAMWGVEVSPHRSGCPLCALGYAPFKAENIMWHQVNGGDPFRCSAPDLRQIREREMPR